MDLDLWDCFGRKKIRLISKEIRYLELWFTGLQIKRLFGDDSLFKVLVVLISEHSPTKMLVVESHLSSPLTDTYDMGMQQHGLTEIC